MTEAATQFITPVTMQALSNRQVFTSQWDAREANVMAHINLTRGASAVLVAPASADFMGKLLHGRADDLLSLLCLARPTGTPLLLAPAMNREMWAHPATQRNVAQLRADGATVLGVGNGEQACGEQGDGRMLEPGAIVQDLIAALQPQRLAGQSVLITAGPTYETLDPVRGLTNRSSGKMGFALARAAREVGAEVTLVAGPVALATPHGVRRIDVVSARDMLEATVPLAQNAHIFIATAAVADWRPAQLSEHKVKKSDAAPPVLTLTENPDVLATVAASARARDGGLFCVGFAAETQALLANAQAKRLRKGVPLLVGNIGPGTFGLDDNQVVLIDEHGTRPLGPAPKLAIARLLIAAIADRTGASG